MFRTSYAVRIGFSTSKRRYFTIFFSPGLPAECGNIVILRSASRPVQVPHRVSSGSLRVRLVSLGKQYKARFLASRAHKRRGRGGECSGSACLGPEFFRLRHEWNGAKWPGIHYDYFTQFSIYRENVLCEKQKRHTLIHTKMVPLAMARKWARLTHHFKLPAP